MPALTLRSRKVRALRMSSTDQEFEDLLRRAADTLKNRRSTVDGEAERTTTREPIQMPEADSKI